MKKMERIIMEDQEASFLVWRDKKRYFWSLGLLVPLLPFIAWSDVLLTGLSVFWFYGPLIVFGVLPFLEIFIGTDTRGSPPDRVIKRLEQDAYYRWCLYLFFPIQYAGLIFSCWIWSHGNFTLLDNIGLALTLSIVSGIAINIAHELGHGHSRLDRWLSKIALAQSGYGHFLVEHNRGHHVRVATPEDPASARFGESFWAFLPRVVIGSLRSSWALESKRLARMGYSPWTLRNDLLNAWIISVILLGLLIAVFGVVVLPYLVIQAVVGFMLLEAVNYIEHYGLLRQKDENGDYERVRLEHSWNSNTFVSNIFLHHLQHHSDHHVHPTRCYQALRHVDEAPQLPTGYAGMILLALFPPIWYRVMNQRLLAHYSGDITRVNKH